jgi:tryptophan synthase alpha chain
MSAIANAFVRVRREGRGGFIPYITAGDPDLAATYDILLALGRAGATVIELGFPFSDPMADGPVIQRACARALKNRVTMRDVLAVAREAKSKLSCPVVLFSYLNPVLQYGLERMITNAGENGISGLLLTDLPADNAARLGVFAREHQVDLITLAAPTCTDERLKIVCAHAAGFIYAVSRTGVTGTRQQLSDDARLLVGRIRRFSPLPVALGFGVSTGQQAREVLTFADAVVVGSAIVQAIEANPGREGLVAAVEKLARDFQPQSGSPTADEACSGDPGLAVKETH